MNIFFVETGQSFLLAGFLPPFLHYVCQWTNSASERRGAEKHLWSAFYWYAYSYSDDFIII